MSRYYDAKRLRRWILIALLSTLNLLGSLVVAQDAGGTSTKTDTQTKKAITKPDRKPPLYSVKQLTEHIEKLKAKAHEAKGEKSKEPQEKALASKVPIRAEDEAGLDYLEAWLFYLQQRAYPNDTVDWSAYERAVQHRARMAPQVLPAFGLQWEYVGPRNLPVPHRIFHGQGNTIGRVNALAYHPTQAGTYYLGAASGGIWKSTDFGQTWTPLTDDWEFLHVSSIAIHPSDPDVIYVGTGDFDGWVGYGMGVMKSTDGGQTWTNLGRSDFGTLAVSKVLIDPENPNIITVTTGRGATYWGQIWRSTNGGTSWTVVNTTFAAWSDVVYGARNPNNGRRYYYAVGHADNGGEVWRSSDRGATWTKLSPPLSNDFKDSLEITTSPTSSKTVYLMASPDRVVLKSKDTGNTWTDVTNNFPPGVVLDNWQQAWWDSHLYCSTRTVNGNPKDVLYAGLTDLAQSANGGGSWKSIARADTGNARIHVDQHCMAINPNNPNEALVGNDGGVYRLTYDPNANSVSFATTLNRLLGITQFYKADFHPTDPNKILGGTQDNATPKCSGDLNNWDNVGAGDGGFCAINPADPNKQYATYQFLGIYRTTNDWASFDEITPDFGSDQRAFIAPIALDPGNPNRLYAGSNYLWRWEDTTQTWTPRLGNQLLSANGSLLCIAVAPSDSNRTYTGSNEGELWMTANGGSTWTQIDSGNPSLPNRALTDIAVHPTNPNKIYVALSGTGRPHAWRCDDTTAINRVWVNISGSGINGLPDIPANAVALDPTNPDTTLYVGMDVGVFYTTDGGSNWLNGTAPFGLPNVQVNDLKAVPGTGYLNATTYGRGIWRIQLPFR